MALFSRQQRIACVGAGEEAAAGRRLAAYCPRRPRADSTGRRGAHPSGPAAPAALFCGGWGPSPRHGPWGVSSKAIHDQYLLGGICEYGM